MTIASSARRNALTLSAPCTCTAAEMLSSGLWGCSWARNHNRSWAKDRGQLSDFALRGIACRRLKTLLCRAALDSQRRATSLRRDTALEASVPSRLPALRHRSFLVPAVATILEKLAIHTLSFHQLAMAP